MSHKHFEGNLDGQNLNIGIIVGQYNQDITDNLLQGAVEQLESYGASQITIYKVPGIFEIPLVAQKLAREHKHDGLIALGCVIKGKTDHYEMINEHLISGLTKIILDFSIPIAFEVIAAHSRDVALERSDMDKINIGREAATAVVKTVRLLKQL